MQKSGNLPDFLGRHDFAVFARGSDGRKNCVRNIKQCTVQKKGNLIRITIVGNAFLSGMIRAMVNVLIKVGQGKFEPSVVKDILDSRKKIVSLSPSHGLCLIKVQY